MYINYTYIYTYISAIYIIYMTESSQSAVRKKKEKGSVTAIYDIRYEHIPLIKAIYIHTYITTVYIRYKDLDIGRFVLICLYFYYIYIWQ